MELLSEAATIVDTKLSLKVVKEDPKDDHLIECAVEVDAGYIISGDNHLRRLVQFRNTKIVSVSEFFRE